MRMVYRDFTNFVLERTIFKDAADNIVPGKNESIFLSRVEGSMSRVEGTMSRVIFFQFFFFIKKCGVVVVV